ncbi:MAG: sulfotransferase family 2 domain-containing protein [Gomphosphaeria aponina SAG 52.96 = DSM 107014]|uniref:Sulfotransferase family 2 domain-containing protein n=1 Tax=Gomphosphaeria aponina SAG 52.96 = DSM 107014 TaxID=1521640 RepID=A0A941GVJ5_9CHRO|nr:sulfotransferase family 2 domain-containing protein [Gomphosphaeria aponina SAG 52.96 = DSM 107014]
MIISHRHKFIFVHIYKTAGTSINDCLIKYGRMRERLLHDFDFTRRMIMVINKKFNLRWQDDGFSHILGLHNHSTAQEIKEYLGEQLFNQYFKFAFVRNPWDWQLSFYFFLKRIKTHQLYELANNYNFPEFLKIHLDSQPPLLLDFLTDSQGNIIVDKIGRLENIEQDFREIIQKIALDPNLLVLPQKNVSENRQRGYQSYYDQKSAALVAEYFQKDINYFQYTFE